MAIPTRLYVVGAVLAGALSLGALWLHEHDKRVRADAQAKVYADSVALLRKRATDDSAKIVKADSIAHANALAMAALALEAKQREDAAKASTQEAVKRLRETLTDNQRQQLDGIVLQYDARLAAKDSFYIASARLAKAASDAQITARDSAIAGLRQQVVTLQNAWDNERKRSNPSIAKKLLDTGIKVGVGYAIRALTTND